VDRCAVFVDAGYVYAEGGRLCCGSRSRAEVRLDPAALVDLLSALAVDTTSLPVLRTYWYDAAKDGIRTQEQKDIAALDDVKVRLGRLNGRGQQKGVDALIYRDLMTLAQQRSISDAVLVSGDEDLREGVRAAQDMGVRVVLVGVECTTGHNQSEELVLEADRSLVLGRSRLQPMFASRRPAAATPRVPTTAAELAVDFAGAWLDRATETEIAELWVSRPRIPRPLDLELLIAVETGLGLELREREAVKRAARASFWGTVGSRMQRADRLA
jgi:uncharacterized LabA/DUF88 family protein